MAEKITLKDVAKEATDEFLKMKNPPTAFFVSNEPMTNGALLALKENKVKIPEEMSIIGFDDSVWAPLTNPALTTVTQPSYSMGTLACQSLLKEIKGIDRSKTRPEDIVLKPKLIIRESCAERIAEKFKVSLSEK